MGRTGLRIGAAALGLMGLAGLSACTTPTGHGQLVISQKCADLDFPIYFQRFSAKLTRPALEIIADAGKQSQGCPVSTVSVLGLSGGKAGAQKNLDLSSKRASAVAKALADAGFPEPTFNVSGAAAQTPDADTPHEPLLRRAEVVIKFTR